MTRWSWSYFLIKTILHKAYFILNVETIIANTSIDTSTLIEKRHVKWLTYRSLVCSVYSWFLVTFEGIA